MGPLDIFILLATVGGAYWIKRTFESWLSGERKPAVIPARTAPSTPKETAEAMQHIAVADRLIENISKRITAYSYDDYLVKNKGLYSVAESLNKVRRLDPSVTIERHGLVCDVDHLTAQACWMEALNHKAHAEAFVDPTPAARPKESLYRAVTAQALDTTTAPTLSSKYYANKSRFNLYQSAVDAITKAVHYAPHDITYRREQVTILMQQGATKAARTALADALTRFPNDLDLHTLKALL